MKNEKIEVVKGRRLSNAESYGMNLGEPAFQTPHQEWLNEILDKLNAIPQINPIPAKDIEKLFISSKKTDFVPVESFGIDDFKEIESFKEQGFTEEQARKMYKIAKSYSEFAPVSMESALNIIKNNT